MNRVAYAALWLLVFSISSEPTFRGFGVVGSQITGVVALALALVAFATSGRVRRLHPFHVAAALFLIWMGCGLLFFYTNWQEVPNKFWTFVQLFVLAWLVWEIAPTRDRQLGLMAAYVLGAYISAVDTILLWRRQAEMLRRFAAGGVDNNDLAMMLALAVPMAWYLGMTHRRLIMRWVYSAYLPFALFAVGLTGSRGGMLATVVALLIVPLTMSRLSPARRAVAIVLLWISGAVAVAYVPQTLMERLASTRAEVEGGRLGGRWKIWQAGMRAFTVRPVVGYGPAAFKRAIAPWLVTRSQVAHNSFLSVLVEEGIVGLILYMVMFVAIFRAVMQLQSAERRFALVLLATLVMSMLPLSAEASKRVWFVFAVLIGFAQAYRLGPALPGNLRGRQEVSLRRPPSGVSAREPLRPVRNINYRAPE